MFTVVRNVCSSNIKNRKKVNFRYLKILNNRGIYTIGKDNGSEEHELFKDQLLELKKEREELFGFTDEERNSWINSISQQGISGKNGNIMNNGKTDVKEHECGKNKVNDIFSHVSESGDSCSMVDIGRKVESKRFARARSLVIFPPEVMSAFSIVSRNKRNELIGPKGPIFSTAKIAGIMAAKRTADLIPLCHPLPLDYINVDIELKENKVVIICECRVTHKTGVEMEALVGASITALTIYDMVKAVSHRVEIKETVLVKKTGGKTDVV